MIEIKKIKKISLANIFAFFYTVGGFLAVICFYGYALIMALKTGETAEPLNKFILVNIGIGFLAGFFTAFIAGLIGWLIGFFGAGLYNIFAKRSGGLKIEVEGLVETKPVEEIRQKEIFPF